MARDSLQGLGMGKWCFINSNDSRLNRTYYTMCHVKVITTKDAIKI
jgi:hypothetical protein